MLNDKEMNDKAIQVKSIFCNVSQRAFTIKPCLTRHIQNVHGKAKPFLCNICQKTFTQKQGLTGHILTGHIQTIHEKSKPFLCKICQKTFKQKKKYDWAYSNHS